MANVQLKPPDDFAERLAKLGDRTDEIIPKVLEAGGEVVLDAVRRNLQSVLSGDSTGELEGSLGLSPAKQNRDGSGWDIKVGFAEPRSDGSSNAKLANILEYGRHSQPPRPFLKPARTKSRKAAVDAMKAKLESEVGNV